MNAGSNYTRAGSATNTNSDIWKTVTFALPDAAMKAAANDQSDFRIWSANPVTVHSVQTSITGQGVLPMDPCPTS